MPNDFDVSQFIGKIGSGKSMTIAHLINRFFEQTTNNYQDKKTGKFYSLGKAFSNLHLFKTKRNPLFRERDFHFTPIGILPLHLFEKFNDKYHIKIPIFVAFDDSESISMYLHHFLNETTSWSRKFHLDLNFVGHYEKDIQKRIRSICNNLYVVNLMNKDYMEGILYKKKTINDNGNIFDIQVPNEFIIENIFDDCKDLYDTNERVKNATPILFEKEILKNCKGMNRDELEQTLICYIKDKKQLEKKIEYFSEKLNIKK